MLSLLRTDREWATLSEGFMKSWIVRSHWSFYCHTIGQPCVGGASTASGAYVQNALAFSCYDMFRYFKEEVNIYIRRESILE